MNLSNLDSEETESDWTTDSEEEDDGSRIFVPDNQIHTIWFLKYAKTKCVNITKFREIRVTDFNDIHASAWRVDGGWDVAFGGDMDGIFNNEHHLVKRLNYRYLGPITQDWEGRQVDEGPVFNIQAPTLFGEEQ